MQENKNIKKRFSIGKSKIKIIRRICDNGKFFYTASCRIKNCSFYGHGESTNEAIKNLYENLDIVLEYNEKWGSLI